MTLVLERQAETRIPVEVDGITPARLRGLSERDVAVQKIWFGRRQLELGQLFRIRGNVSDTQTIRWIGDLEAVHGIGAGLSAGIIEIESSAGRHVGSRMSGGSIVTESDVSDYVGLEMTGGTIRVGGNAGDLAGGNFPGSKVGMNRGEILIAGNVGRGCGQAMRRGTIVVGGDVGKLCGWNMLAGTIVVLGNCGPECGAGMVRGTIILAGSSQYSLMPTFAQGGCYGGYMFGLIANRLGEVGFSVERLNTSRFQMHHGDSLRGGRGEIFIVTE